MPKIFTEQEKAELRECMFEKGFELLKEVGMTHMSVEKIMTSCNLGKSTFYNFFISKEAFVSEMIEYKRKKALRAVQDKLNGRRRMSTAEGMDLLKSVICSTDSIYQYLKLEDLLKLQKTSVYLSHPDAEEETGLLQVLFQSIEAVKQDLDYPLIANLLKVITLVSEEKEFLHPGAYAKTVEALYHTLFEVIFESGEV